MWKTKLKNDPVPWLISSNPWTKYRTLIDLLNRPNDSKEVLHVKEEMLNHPYIKSLIDDISNWFPESITRHNDPKLTHYKLRILADFGFTISNHNIKKIIDIACNHYKNGLFTIRQDLPNNNFTKPDKTSNNWNALPCDSPLLTSIFLKMQLKNDRISQSADIIKEKWKNKEGWFCHFFFVENQFKKLQIGCPMAGLHALEVFSQIPELKKSEYAVNAFAPIKYHYESGKSLYYFGRSKKFWTLKYPFVWYNALYMAYVLSKLDFIKEEQLMKELINWIIQLQDVNGKFKPTSIFQIYKHWDFGNKKESSPWITYLCCLILKNFYN